MKKLLGHLKSYLKANVFLEYCCVTWNALSYLFITVDDVEDIFNSILRWYF